MKFDKTNQQRFTDLYKRYYKLMYHVAFVFENLLCDAAAQLREERLEKIKLPHKNRHILRAFAVCVCAAILSLQKLWLYNGR